VKAVIRPRGRQGGFDDAALATLALVVKTASLPPSRATAAVVQAATGWGRSTTHKALVEAVRRGLVERVGRTKGAWYRIPAPTAPTLPSGET
jgi:DNA-binding IclR family transcriptional regulator